MALLLHIIIFFIVKENYSANILPTNIGTKFNAISLTNISLYDNKANKINNSISTKHNNISQLSKSKKPISNNNINNIHSQHSNKIPTVKNFTTIGNRQLPIYPKRSLKLGQEGLVYLKILISKAGDSEEIKFIKKSQYPLLNKSALDAVKKWQFKPIIINGKAVKSWIEVPIEFKIS